MNREKHKTARASGQNFDASEQVAAERVERHVRVSSRRQHLHLAAEALSELELYGREAIVLARCCSCLLQSAAVAAICSICWCWSRETS